MYKNIHEVTIASLKENCTMIHYFGLGFIQVKLGDRYRMHFYTDRLPAITNDEDIHNHRYDFTSSIFHGSFTQDIFMLVDGDTHVLSEESCKEGVEAVTSPKPCGVQKLITQYFARGSSYWISHETFHRVNASDAITFLDRGDVIAKENALVARAVNAPKVCPFAKKVPEPELWEIIEGMLSSISAAGR